MARFQTAEHLMDVVQLDSSGNVVVPQLKVNGTSTFVGAQALTAVSTGPLSRLTTNSATVGATVALAGADSGKVYINVSSSGSPSWTLPSAVAGRYYTFICGDSSTGFTVTGGTIKAKTNASGTAISGTTLTNTQATAVVGDTITLVCDGTNWLMVAQSGIFAAS